jgi:hypothetical protein
MGQVYYDMGLLASTEVVEMSATDLVGQYVGQTGPKTQSALERGLGKVLFIDEAYRLAEGHFAKEAMDELVDCITKPRFATKLIIILAGYDTDINRLMSINPGLTSRFPESLQFNSLSPKDCIHLLIELLSKQKKDLLKNSQTNFDITCLHCSDPDLTSELTQAFDSLSKTASWANARDVGTLAKAIFGKTVRMMQVTSSKELVLGRETVREEVKYMITERSSRENFQAQHSSTGLDNGEKTALRTQHGSPPAAHIQARNFKSDVASNDMVDEAVQPVISERDAGVTDDVWNQLEKDKVAAEAREKEFLNVIKNEEEQKKKIQRLKEEEDMAARQVDEARQQENEDLRKRHEQARLLHEIERRKQEAIEKERHALAEARRKEQVNQEKLRKMGVCVAGYQWIKQTGGYRCAGGFHWVSDAQLR